MVLQIFDLPFFVIAKLINSELNCSTVISLKIEIPGLLVMLDQFFDCYIFCECYLEPSTIASSHIH